MAIGQHFLVNRSVVAKILEAADLHEDDQVLEIGPGRGAITLEMAKRVRLVKAVELDHELAIRLPKLDNLQVIEGDFLQVDLEELLGKAPCLDDQRLCCSKALQKQGVAVAAEGPAEREIFEAESFEGPSDAKESPTVSPVKPWKVVANLPYYITTPIIEKLLNQGRHYIGRMIVMVQKEVALRIQSLACRDSGAFSYFVNYYARPSILFDVKPGSFNPPPQVDSSVVALDIYRHPIVEAPDKLFLRVTRAAFNMRRKTLRKSLSGLAASMGADLELALELAQIPGNRRPEQLTMQEFSALALALQKAGKAELS